MIKHRMLMSDSQKRIEKFMLLAKQKVPEYPEIPDEATRRLRATIIFEEVMETIKGLGFDVVVSSGLGQIKIREQTAVNFVAAYQPDLVEIVDGCCDIQVVTIGTMLACGCPDDTFQREVDQNNLDKFGPGHSIREDGKLVKPPGHKSPRIQEILESIKKP